MPRRLDCASKGLSRNLWAKPFRVQEHVVSSHGTAAAEVSS